MRQIALDNKYIKEVCKIGQVHDCCRYLIGGEVGLQCAKLEPELKVQLDERVNRKTITARGDNCEGKSMYDER